MYKRGYRIPSYQFAVFLYILQVSFSRGRLAISHLFFANDLVLLGKADTKNCLSMMDALKESCGVSGQIIYKEKSRVYFSPM